MLQYISKKGCFHPKMIIHPQCHSKPVWFCFFCGTRNKIIWRMLFFFPNSPKKSIGFGKPKALFVLCLFVLWSSEVLVLLSVACWDHFCHRLFEIVLLSCKQLKHRIQKSINTHFSNTNSDLLLSFYECADDACCSVSELMVKGLLLMVHFG